jgi:predicted DsbA family dithiol-disulfide isomerase
VSDPEPFGVTVYYDFASSLCYVGHRVMGRLAPFLEELRCELGWVPVDLAGMMRWQRGARVPPDRVTHVERVAETLRVPLRVPGRWLDSRDVGAAALVLARRDVASGEQREASWRERVWTAIYEEGRNCTDREELARMAGDLEVGFPASELEEAREELDRRTGEAVEAMVTGVPTFMLGPWPFGGIQEDETMRSILQRFADRQRGLR